MIMARKFRQHPVLVALAVLLLGEKLNRDHRRVAPGFHGHGAGTDDGFFRAGDAE